MRTGASDIQGREHHARIRPDARLKRPRKSRLRRNALEWLEPRTLMAVIPAAQIARAPIDISPNGGNMSSPLVAIDRYDSQKLVSVWVRNDADLAPANQTLVAGAYSADGGATWSSLGVSPPPLLDPAVAPPTSGPPTTYTQTINPSVAFDANHRVYVLTQQTNGGNTSGALILRRFDFSGNSPTAPTTTIVRQYIQDPVFNPTLTVDDNVPSFTDPTTGQTQHDLLDRNGGAYSGNVWIAWSTSETAPNGFQPANKWNPNSIQVISSSDGGNSFTSPLLVNNSGRIGDQRLATPRIAVSQGKSDGTGGQATIIWDDFGTGAAATPAFDLIESSRITDGGTAYVAQGPGGLINQATDPGNGAPHNPATTSYPVTVNLADPKFIALTNLTVKLNLQQAALNEIMVELVAPDGTRVTLFRNQTDAAGQTPNPAPSYGITGANLGIAPNGLVGTVFDDRAARSIDDRGATAPFVATFQPEGSLSVFNGRTAAQLNGTWRLVITDFRATAPPTPPRRPISS